MSSLLPWLAPYSGWAVMLALAVVGLTLVFRATFAKRRASPHCPKCGYDLSHSPTPTCSECGHTLRSPAEAFTAPRRYRMVLLGLAICVALPAYVAQMRVRAEGWDYYLRLYPLYWFFPDVTNEEYRSGPYFIRFFEDRRRNYNGARFDDRRVTVARNGEIVWSVGGWIVGGGIDANATDPTTVTLPAITDLDGDGIPEFICEVQGNGVGFPESMTYVLRLGEKLEDLNPHTPAQIDIDRDGIYYAVDPKHDGHLHFLAHDLTFYGSMTSNAGSPVPEVYLTLRRDRLRADPDLMRAAKSPLTPDQLSAVAKECHATYDAAEGNGVLYAELLDPMVTLIYSGHSPEAYAFLDAAWPGTDIDKQNFLQDFRKQLARSPYRDAIEALGHPALPPSEP